MNIIIPIINTGIGDFVMTLPMLKNIEENDKIKPIILFNKKIYKDIFEKSFVNTNRFKIIMIDNSADIKMWKKLKQEANIIVSPTVGIKPLILWKLLGFKIYSKPLIFKNKFYTFVLRTYGIPKEHDVVNNINILNKLYEDYPDIGDNLIVYTPTLNIKNNKEKIIYVHPGFDGNSKIPKDWGINNWLNLIKKLANFYKDYKIKIIIGPGWEEKFKDNYFDLAEKFDNVEVIYKIDFNKLLDELSKGELLINTDSGIGHIAGALGLKTITIFGPADEKQTGVFSQYSNNIRAKGSSPCYSQGIWIRDCKDNGKQDKIKVDDILNLTKKIILI